MIEEIKTIQHLKDGKTVINDLVTVWFENEKVQAGFNKEKISQDQALGLVNIYLNSLLELMKSANETIH